MNIKKKNEILWDKDCSQFVIQKWNMNDAEEWETNMPAEVFVRLKNLRKLNRIRSINIKMSNILDWFKREMKRK